MMNVRGNIHSFVFIACINNTGYKLFAGVNDTGDNLSRCGYYHGIVDTGEYTVSRILIDSMTTSD
jgi:hypothetical protein